MTDKFTVPRHKLGSTGIEVSCLGLGTVKFGRNQGVKYPEGFELPTDAQIVALLERARSHGINLLDTAPAYGSSEERLGKLMGRRDDWVICTKTGEEFSDGKSSFDFSAQHTQRSVERSLKRLGTDYLDLVLVHSDGNDESIIRNTDCFDTLARLRDKGVIRAFGFSGKTVAGGLLALQHCDVVMVTCNPVDSAEIPVIEQARQLGKGVLIKKAFNSGHIVARHTDTSSDPATAALRFVFSHPGVSAVVVGTLSPDHLTSNARAACAALSYVS